MAVVAAGVHHAVVLGLEGQVADLLDRQRVHVSAQEHRLARRAAVHEPDDAGTTNAGANVDVQRSQAVRYKLGGAVFLVAKLRVGVHVAPVGDDFAGEASGFVEQLHGKHLQTERGVHCRESSEGRGAVSISGFVSAKLGIQPLRPGPRMWVCSCPAIQRNSEPCRERLVWPPPLQDNKDGAVFKSSKVSCILRDNNPTLPRPQVGNPAVQHSGIAKDFGGCGFMTPRLELLDHSG